MDGILDHSFFTRSGAFTPTSLPESALREPPHEHVPLRLSADVLADQRKSYTGETFFRNSIFFFILFFCNYFLSNYCDKDFF